MKLHDALYGVTRLGFDTSPIIYFVEANPQYDARVTWVFQQVAGGALQGLTSVVTLSEVLVAVTGLGEALAGVATVGGLLVGGVPVFTGFNAAGSELKIAIIVFVMEKLDSSGF